MKYIIIATALLLGLSACAGIVDKVQDVRTKAQGFVKEKSGAIVDEYCAAVPGSSTQQELRSRLHLYLDNRIITEIDCGEPT